MAGAPQNIDYDAVEAALEKYYLGSTNDIAGHGEYVQGTIFSKGRGFGSVIRAVIRAATPIVKKVGHVLKPMVKKAGQYAAKRAVDIGADSIIDITQGVPPAQAFQQNAEKAMEDTMYDLGNAAKAMKRRSVLKKGPRAKKFKRYNF